MFQMDRLDHVALTVTDLERSTSWYQLVLRLEQRFQYRDTTGYGHPVGLCSGDACIVLFPAEPGHTVVPLQGHVAFRLTRQNFDEMLTHLQQQGIPTEYVEYAKVHSVYCTDPDGYQIELSTFEL